MSIFSLFPKLFPDLCLDLVELRVLWGKNAVLANNSCFKYSFIDFLKTEASKDLFMVKSYCHEDTCYQVGERQRSGRNSWVVEFRFFGNGT